MTPFRATFEQILELAAIMVAMAKVGLDHEFIVEASDLARTERDRSKPAPMTHMVDASGSEHSFAYDADGRLLP